MKIDHTVLGKLLPFHLIFRKDGAVIGQGETLKKCIGALKNVSEDLIGYRFKAAFQIAVYFLLLQQANVSLLKSEISLICR